MCYSSGPASLHGVSSLRCGISYHVSQRTPGSAPLFVRWDGKLCLRDSVWVTSSRAQGSGWGPRPVFVHITTNFPPTHDMQEIFLGQISVVPIQSHELLNKCRYFVHFFSFGNWDIKFFSSLFLNLNSNKEERPTYWL